MLRRGWVALVLLLLLAACSDDGDAGGGDRLTVFAASSLTEAFRALDVEADYSFGSSSRLAFQVEQGAPVDALATVDDTAIRGTGLRRLMIGDEIVEFATNRLVIGHRGVVRTAADLGRPGLKVVMAAPSVPAGRHGVDALRAVGVEVTPVSFEPDVKAVAAKVASGEADAGVIYATDARAAELQAIDLDAEVRYFAAAYSVEGRRFLEVLRSDKGQRVLREHGFGPP